MTLTLDDLKETVNTSNLTGGYDRWMTDAAPHPDGGGPLGLGRSARTEIGGDGSRAEGTKGERTRRALLEVAIARFARDGYRSTSLADIARDARLSPTAAYAYFPNKEALFIAAVDTDAAEHIGEAMASVLEGRWEGDWRNLITSLIDALDNHPLARRVLAGLEPEFTVRLLGIAALQELRAGLTALLASEQQAGLVRADIDPAAIAGGLVTIVLSMLLSLLQMGAMPEGVDDEVLAVLEASLHVPAQRLPPR